MWQLLCDNFYFLKSWDVSFSVKNKKWSYRKMVIRVDDLSHKMWQILVVLNLPLRTRSKWRPPRRPALLPAEDIIGQIDRVVTLVVYYLHEKTGWSTVCTSGKQKSRSQISIWTGVYHLHNRYEMTRDSHQNWSRARNWWKSQMVNTFSVRKFRLEILNFLSRRYENFGNFPVGNTKIALPFTF